MTTAATDPADLPTAEANAKDAPGRGKGALSETVELAKTVIYALLIALVLRVVLFQPYTIPSASMEPALYQGDYIIVSKFAYGWSRHSIPTSPPLFEGRLFGRSPARGDIIVFKLPRDGHTDFIKRVIGLPGDRIQVSKGEVSINGRPVVRKSAGTGPATCPGGGYLGSSVPRWTETLPGGKAILTNDCEPDNGNADNTATYVVPANCYFMMGDNRDNSMDSRFPTDTAGAPGERKCGWNHDVDNAVHLDPATEAYLDKNNFGVGFVPAENLVGRADLILLSWKPGASLFKPWTWFLNIRPSRFFHLLG